jgi:hypothetical protein
MEVQAGSTISLGGQRLNLMFRVHIEAIIQVKGKKHQEKFLIFVMGLKEIDTEGIYRAFSCTWSEASRRLWDLLGSFS